MTFTLEQGIKVKGKVKYIHARRTIMYAVINLLLRQEKRYTYKRSACIKWAVRCFFVFQSQKASSKMRKLKSGFMKHVTGRQIEQLGNKTRVAGIKFLCKFLCILLIISAFNQSHTGVLAGISLRFWTRHRLAQDPWKDIEVTSFKCSPWLSWL